MGRFGVRLSCHPTHPHFQDTKDQRPAQAEFFMDRGDWKTHLSRDSRIRNVNRIMDTLKRYLPFSGPDGLRVLWKIAEKFEEMIYSTATSESDYLWKISSKMLAWESKCLDAAINSLQSNCAAHSKKFSYGMKSLAMKESHMSSIDMLKRHLPVSGPEGLHELRKSAERLEEKIYYSATSESDYLRKIHLKVLLMEAIAFNPATNSLPSNCFAHRSRI